MNNVSKKGGNRMNKIAKKVIGLGVIISMLSVLLLSGCGSTKTSDGGKTSDAGNTDKELPKVTWKFSHTQAPEHFYNIAVENMAKKVSEKTDGKFTIEVFHSGTLGAEQEIIEGMQLGTIAGNLAAANLLGNFVPAYDIFSLPGVFKDEDHIRKVFNDPSIMDQFKQKALDVGIRVEGYYQDFFRQLYTKEPVTNVESLNSQKIRVMGSPYLVDSFQALGANPTTTAWAELYTGLQLGVVDGLDHVAASIRSMSFYEHLNYMCEPKIFASPMFLIISKPLYEKLPEEYKSVLDEAVKETLNELNEVANQHNNQDIEFLKTEGGLEYTKVDIAEIHKALEEVTQKYVSKLEPWVQDVASKIRSME